MERSRRRVTQPHGSPSATAAAPTSTQASPRASRRTSTTTPTMDDTPSFTPSGRPLRQKSAANLRNVTPPPTVPSSSRPVRSSSSRAIKKDVSPIDNYEDGGDEYMEEDAEEEIAAPLRSKRSTRGLKQQQQSPAPLRAAEVEPVVNTRERQQRQASTSSPLKVMIGGRGRASTRNSKKRARLAEEEDAGWMSEVDEEDEAQLVFTAIVAKIEAWLTEKGSSKLQNFFKKIPAGAEIASPITLPAIGERISKGEYASTIDFEKDMLLLFHNGRRYFEVASEDYAGLATLQRLYNHLTQSAEAAKGDVDDEIKNRNYASLKYGPCEDQGEGQGEAVEENEKMIVPYIRYKGHTISVGDFVHLSNPTDPSRPIIAQVFKTKTEDLGDGRQDWITACWFLRPEQTKHPRTMLFWPNEALKTSQFVEHHIEDFLEVVCVMYYTRYMKGRPAEGEGGWKEGDPLYICENRFHAEKGQIYKIKNWIGIMPEEIRNKRFDLIEYDEPLIPPAKLKSPFLLGSNGPGSIIDENQRLTVPAPSLQRSNSSFLGSNSGVASPIGGDAAGGDAGTSSMGSLPRRVGRPAGTTLYKGSAAGATTTMTKIVPLFREWSDEMKTQREAFLKVKAEKDKISSEEKNQGKELAAEEKEEEKREMPPVAPVIDRSVSNAMIQLDVPAYYKTLPSETRDLFHQDAESGNVLWYPSPPVMAPSEVKSQRTWNHGDKLAMHSLDYLYYLATLTGNKKRKVTSS